MKEIKLMVGDNTLEEFLSTICKDIKFNNDKRISEEEKIYKELKDIQIQLHEIREIQNNITDHIDHVNQRFQEKVMELQSTQLEDHKSFWQSFKDSFSGSSKKKVKQTTVNLNE